MSGTDPTYILQCPAGKKPVAEEQPEKLEKSDEVPETAEDVQLDSAAIPSGSLATDTKEEAQPSEAAPQVLLSS